MERFNQSPLNRIGIIVVAILRIIEYSLLRRYITFDSMEAATKALAVIGSEDFINRGVYGSMASPSNPVNSSKKKQAREGVRIGLLVLM